MTADEAMALTRTTELADRPTASCRRAKSARCSSPSPCAAVRRCCSSTSPPSASTCRRARRSGRPSAQLLAQGASIVLTTHYLEEAEALAGRVAVLAKGRLMAMGTVDEIRGVVGRKRISCLSALPPDKVAAWAGVDRRHDATASVCTSSTRDADDVVRRLLAADAALCDLEVQRAGLAEAFTEMTQEAA